jgi:hypothetical protein
LKSGERLFGTIVTSVGIALLLIVFYLAYQMLTHPVPGLAASLSTSSSNGGDATNALGGVGSSVIDFLLKLAVLFVMTLAGSHISARGVQLYQGIHHASTGLSAPSNSNGIGRGPSSVSEGAPEPDSESTGRQ